jgi:regulator of RNase E activity RraA
MHGPDFARPDPRHVAVLQRASSASITSILRRRDIHKVGIPLKPVVPGLNRVVGPALTLRSVPGREDIRPLAYQEGTLYPGHPDDAIEALQPGDVLVHDGLGLTDQGLFGDLLVYRVKMRGAAGLVSWMCIRDLPHMAERGLPIFCLGSISQGGTVYNVDYNVPINCAGTLVIPGDVVVGDEDGVAVIPRALVPQIVEDVQYHEEREVFLRKMLAEGAPLKGTYPPSEETDRRFREWREQMGREGRSIL